MRNGLPLRQMLWRAFAALTMAMPMVRAAAPAETIDIGDRREVFWDSYLVDTMQGCEFRQHHPEPKEVALLHDVPWEWKNSWLHTVLTHGDAYRMYYLARDISFGDALGGHQLLHPLYFATAESKDGIVWTRPDLNLVPLEKPEEHRDAPNNLIPLDFGEKVRGIKLLFPFRDENPACAADARFKALSSRVELPDGSHGLYALRSADGIEWQLMSDKPILTGCTFDSYNLAFWDPQIKAYRAYVRHRRGEELVTAVRGIMTATSKDFLSWGKLEWLEYDDAAEEHVYNPNVQRYPRAPHLYVGFPLRYVEKPWNWHASTLADPGASYRKGGGWSGGVGRYGSACTEPWFMFSRDGKSFVRSDEPFIRARRGCWAYGDNYVACGLLMTKEDWYSTRASFGEMSFYVVEGYYEHETPKPPCRVRRYTMRPDGFISIRAGRKGGTFTTKPFIFKGRMLTVNFQTAIGGTIDIEILNADGDPYVGFEAEDCWTLYGNHVDQTVFWHGGVDLSKLEGKPIRLSFALREADLYAMKFLPGLAERSAKPETMINFWYGGAKREPYKDTASRKIVEFLQAIQAEHGQAALSTKVILREFRKRYEAMLKDTPISRESYLEGIQNMLGHVAGSVAIVPRIPQPKIDGKLDDAAWKKAGDLGELVVYDKKTKEKSLPKYPASVRIGYDSENLYLAYHCTEKDVGDLIGAAEERDGPVWRGDAVEFAFLPDMKSPDFVHLILGANKQVYDAFAGDAAWTSRARFAIDKGGQEGPWAVEVAIPWPDLRVTPQSGKLYLGNVMRDNAYTRGSGWHADNVYSTWYPIVAGGFNDPASFGILMLE